MESRIVHLHRDAPSKPLPGEPCNRCGVCCAAETCPAGRLVFRQRICPCPALVRLEGHYACELAVVPERHLPFLPRRLRPLAARLFRRWISAGSGCDSAVEIITATGNPSQPPLIRGGDNPTVESPHPGTPP